MNTQLNQNDPLNLDPRAISILIAVARFPNGVTVNKLASLLSMSYRSIRSLCEAMASQTPPLLAARVGAYTEYTSHPAVNLHSLFDLPPAADRSAKRPTHPSQPSEPIARPPKQPHRKRANLVIDALRVKQLSLDPSLLIVFNQIFKDIESLSPSVESSFSKTNSDQGEQKQDLRWLKSIRIKSCQIDELTLLTPGKPVFQGERPTHPGRTTNLAEDTPDGEPSNDPARNQPAPSTPQPVEEKPNFRKYTPPDTSRMVNINLPTFGFYNSSIINGRRLDPDEINPRHTQQYLLHAAEIMEHAVLWHPQFAVIKEGLVLGWLAQALDGYQRGKLTQPWGIVYRGLLGELNSRYPDKRFRDHPEKLLPSEWLIKAGWEIAEADLPPTPEQDPTWKPSGPALCVHRDYDDQDDDDPPTDSDQTDDE